MSIDCSQTQNLLTADSKNEINLFILSSSSAAQLQVYVRTKRPTACFEVRLNDEKYIVCRFLR